MNQAFERGITARQICTFLTNHAHERMLSSRPVVPETVCDQIMLWETEQVSKRGLLSFSFALKMISSRQARDKHREQLRKEARLFSFFLIRSPTTG